MPPSQVAKYTVVYIIIVAFLAALIILRTWCFSHCSVPSSILIFRHSRTVPRHDHIQLHCVSEHIRSPQALSLDLASLAYLAFSRSTISLIRSLYMHLLASRRYGIFCNIKLHLKTYNLSQDAVWYGWIKVRTDLRRILVPARGNFSIKGISEGLF